jgi:hypothetical protein
VPGLALHRVYKKPNQSLQTLAATLSSPIDAAARIGREREKQRRRESKKKSPAQRKEGRRREEANPPPESKMKIAKTSTPHRS